MLPKGALGRQFFVMRMVRSARAAAAFPPQSGFKQGMEMRRIRALKWRPA